VVGVGGDPTTDADLGGEKWEKKQTAGIRPPSFALTPILSPRRPHVLRSGQHAERETLARLSQQPFYGLTVTSTWAVVQQHCLLLLPELSLAVAISRY